MLLRGLPLVSFFLAFATLGFRPLFEPDEGRYAEVARTMITSGDWLIPRFFGHEHLTKPPFAYWASAAGQLVFGQNEFGARFFVALAFALSSLFLASAVGALLQNPETGRASGLIFATSPLTFALGRFLSADVFAVFWQIVAFWAVVRLWTRPELAARYRLVFAAALGAAFLTKGPPALLVLLFVLPGEFLRRRRGVRATYFAPGALLVFVVTGFSWYVYVVLRDPERLSYFLVEETWNRVATGVHKRETTRWIYLAAFTAGAFPWCIVGRRSIARTWSAIRRRQCHFEPERVALATWLCAGVSIFLLSRSRLVLYVAPLFAPMAALLAGEAARWLRVRGTHGLLIVAWSAVLLAGDSAAPRWVDRLEAKPIGQYLRRHASDGIPVADLTSKRIGSLRLYADFQGSWINLERDAALSSRNVEELECAGLPDQAYLVVRAKDEPAIRALDQNLHVVIATRGLCLLRRGASVSSMR